MGKVMVWHMQRQDCFLPRIRREVVVTVKRKGVRDCLHLRSSGR